MRRDTGAVQIYNHENLDETCQAFTVFAIFQFSLNIKNNPRCTHPIYVLSMCKSRIESVEVLLRLGPRKFIKIVGPLKNSHFFKDSHFHHC